MPELHETMLGRKYYEHTMPEIASQLKRVADALETGADKKLERAYDCLAIVEALTTDKNTADRIREFLINEGIWKK